MTIDASEPQPGHYVGRRVQNGPWVPAKIEWRGDGVTEDRRLVLDMGGEIICDFNRICESWVFLAKHPIDAGTYAFMSDNLAWHRAHEPDSAYANATESVDWAGAGHNAPPDQIIAEADDLIERVRLFGDELDTPDKQHDAVIAAKFMAARIKRLTDLANEAAGPCLALAEAAHAPYRGAAGRLKDARADLMPKIHEARLTLPDGRISTDLGAKAYGAVRISVEVTDLEALPDRFKRTVPDMAMLKQAARLAHDAGEEIPGAKITATDTTVVS